MHLPHPKILESRVWHWEDESACAAWAARLASQTALADAFLTLQGPLGAGKTTLVRHLLKALGVSGRIKSPTYTVMEPYHVGGLDIAHFDFYRFHDPREWEDAGLRDVFARSGLKLAEWPDKAAGALPTPDIALDIAVQAPDPSTHADAAAPREVRAQAFTARGQQLLRALEAE